MEHQLSPVARAGARGFSLIELMVVVTIMSVLTLGVLWGTGAGQSLSPSARASDPARQAQLFKQALGQAVDIAAFTRQPVGLFPKAQGWEVLRRQADGTWVSVGTPGHVEGLRLDWQIGARVHLAQAEHDGSAPAIRVLGDGRSTDFSLRFVPMQGSARPHVCDASGGAGVRCGAL
ncbi:MAG: prepilin-type N-terminal cleavage/methylation domain-containing protein [Roseinatronobacter sp.]